ncbi:interferon-induced protein 44-like [Paramormyrops kingsleyae]|uniref:interferon-induced protein 44-like n=1 Tax=Paramormyrops kingsleyae TaxID=1676925 RepID=UPI003B96E451
MGQEGGRRQTRMAGQGRQAETTREAGQAEQEDVPLMVLLTKVDKACPLVGEDLKNVYRSCYIKDLIYKVSDCLGIPVSQVLPVKNYDHENVLDTCCDVLLLSAMQQMLNFADNYFDNFNNGTE